MTAFCFRMILTPCWTGAHSMISSLISQNVRWSFFRCKSPIFHNYLISSRIIARSVLFKDLGIIVDTKLTFHLHLDYVISKSSSMLGF